MTFSLVSATVKRVLLSDGQWHDVRAGTFEIDVIALTDSPTYVSGSRSPAFRFEPMQGPVGVKIWGKSEDLRGLETEEP